MGGRFSSSGAWLRPHLTEEEYVALVGACDQEGVGMSDYARRAVEFAFAHVSPDELGKVVAKINEVGRELNAAARELNRAVRRYGRALRMKEEERLQLISLLANADALAARACAMSRELGEAQDDVTYVHVRTKFGGASDARPRRVGFRITTEMNSELRRRASGKRGSASLIARSAIIVALARGRGDDVGPCSVATDDAIQSLILSRRRWETNGTQIDDAIDSMNQTLTSSRFIDAETRVRCLGHVRETRARTRETCENLERFFQGAMAKMVEV